MTTRGMVAFGAGPARRRPGAAAQAEAARLAWPVAALAIGALSASLWLALAWLLAILR